MTKVDAILSRIKQESWAEGFARGFAEGFANSSIQHAKKLIELGMPHHQIAWVIDSSEEEVAEIAERMATAPLD